MAVEVVAATGQNTVAARKDFRSIQSLRGLAAGSVVLFHLGTPLQRLGFAYDWPETLCSGVDIFFVISGFIMWMTTCSQPVKPTAFWWKRIVRVVPLYWLMTSVMLAVLLVAPQALQSSAFDLKHIIASYLFVPWHHPVKPSMEPLLFAGWTLNYEMFFYAIFGVFLLLRPSWRLAATVLVFVSLRALGWMLGWSYFSTAGFYASGTTWEFAYGMIIGALVSRRNGATPWGLRPATVLLLLGLFVQFVLPDTPTWPRDIRYGLSSVAIVAGALGLETRGNLRAPAWLMVVGDASYSIYLVHEITMAAFLQIWKHAHLPVNPAGMIAFAAGDMIIAFGSGLLCYRYVEKPLLSLFRSRRVRPPALSAATA